MMGKYCTWGEKITVNQLDSHFFRMFFFFFLSLIVSYSVASSELAS